MRLSGVHAAPARPSELPSPRVSSTGATPASPAARESTVQRVYFRFGWLAALAVLEDVAREDDLRSVGRRRRGGVGVDDELRRRAAENRDGVDLSVRGSVVVRGEEVI